MKIKKLLSEKKSLLLFLLLFGCLRAPSSATVPPFLNIQGRLTDEKGVARNGNFDMFFRIYDADFGGTVLWEKKYEDLQVRNGNFQHLIGSPNGEDSHGTNISSIFNGAQRWLGIQVEGPNGVLEAELVPRQQLASVAHSFVASRVEGDKAVLGSASASIGTRLHVVTDPSSQNVGSVIIEGRSDEFNHTPRIGFVDTTLPPNTITGSPAWFVDSRQDSFRIYRQDRLGMLGEDMIKVAPMSPGAQRSFSFVLGNQVYRSEIAGFESNNFHSWIVQGQPIESGLRFAIHKEQPIIFVPGKIGIGVSNPSEPLHITGTRTGMMLSDISNNPEVHTKLFSDALNQAGVIETYSNHPLRFKTNDVSRMTIGAEGNVGIGTDSPDGKLVIISDNHFTDPSDRANQLIIKGEGANEKYKLNIGFHTEASPPYADIGFVENGTAWRNTVLAKNGGRVGIGRIPLSNSTYKLEVQGDIYTTGALQTAGGRYDLAEIYPTKEALEPGDVVVAAPDAGHVMRSVSAYSTAVLGVVSDKPALAIGTKEPGNIFVALAGRVEVKASAENGPIQPGDLLTSSKIPGHVMKATNPRIGSIVGKSLDTLESGQGKILVYVNLN